MNKKETKKKYASLEERRKEIEAKVARRKSDMTVGIIQHNKETKKLIDTMQEALDACRGFAVKFGNQRELVARSKMTERVINSAMRMLNGNKLQLWMIDDRFLESEVEREEED